MDDQGLKLDYEQTTEFARALTEIRFKLLAFVPTIAGATVALVPERTSNAKMLAVGLLGLAATAGVVLYELRNSQIYDGVVHRAKYLELRLGFEASDGTRPERAGLFAERPERPKILFGRVEAWYGRGLGLVYGAALAGWLYLVLWAGLALLGVPGAKELGGAGAIAGGILTFAEMQRFAEREDKPQMPVDAGPIERAPALPS